MADADSNASAVRQPKRRRERRGGSLARVFLDWRALLGIAISFGLLYYAFRDEDLGLIASEIRRADPLLLLIATALATFIFWIRAWRWRAILEPVSKNTTFRSRFAGVTIGAMGNNLLAARAGEFARAYAFSRMEPVSIVASFSSLVIERLFDGIFLVVFLFLAMTLPGFPPFQVSGDVPYVTGARILIFLIALTFGSLFLMALWPDRFVARFEAVITRILPAKLRRPIIDALEAFLVGVSSLRDPKLILRATFWSAVVWTVNALGFWVAFHAFGMDLPLSAGLFFTSCISLAVSAPSGPGFIGVYQAAAEFVLVTLWGQEAAKALALSIGFYISAFIPVTLIGLFYAYRLGLTLSRVARTEEAVEVAVERETGVDAEHPRKPAD
ncbi:MAG: lysylphosphatidylglycerol synthase transmembrane domain-containing protein [Longimicrobiales bacterium]